MTLQEFNYKSQEEEKIVTVCNNGIYLANLKINNNTPLTNQAYVD